jgi:capsular exopolysaccharide synthesis family protein
MELRAYLTILQRRKWTIMATVALGLATAVVAVFGTQPRYETFTTLRLATPTSGSLETVYYDIGFADRLMNTYVTLARSKSILSEVMQQLNLDRTPEISVEILDNTELIQITAEDSDPVIAAQAANTLAEILIAWSENLPGDQEKLAEQLLQTEKELVQAQNERDTLLDQFPERVEDLAVVERSLASSQQAYNRLLEQYEWARLREILQTNTLSIVDLAVPPQQPSEPNKGLGLVLGGVLGLLAGMMLAFLFENLDTKLYAVELVESETGLPTLGEIPQLKNRQPQVFLNGDSPRDDAYRRLRTNIFALDREKRLQTLLFTSTESNEDKSIIVANLALSIARLGHRIVVVDCDLRRPVLHQMFGISNATGLSNVLKQELSLPEALQESSFPGVQVLTGGSLPVSSTELLASPQLAALIEDLKERFNWVLLDTPSLLAVTDAAMLAPMADGVILVVEYGQTRQAALQAVCRQLSSAQARTLGIIFNCPQRHGNDHIYYPSKTHSGFRRERVEH